MSITFQVEPGDIAGFAVSCDCADSEVIVFGDYADARDFVETDQYSFTGCDEPEYCGYPMVEVQYQHGQTVSVNMSNSNAAAVLEVLGVPDLEEAGYAGVFDADDLLARINIGLAVSLESAEIPTFAEGNVVFGGRPEGYVQNRLHDLIAVAEDAKRLGRPVVWS